MQIKFIKYLLLFLAIPALALNSVSASTADGCTLLVDYKTGKTISKKGDCETRHSPASTFKIPLALIGFDSGILKDEHNPAWEFKEGYTVNKDDDRQTTNPVMWEANSVVWYSQKLTKQLGMKKFRKYVDQFNYGNKDLAGDKGKNNGLTNAWLISSLKISPVEEVNFIKNIFDRKLGVSTKAYEMTQSILPEFKTENGWKVKGKTGSGTLPDNIRSQGWFVGWAEKGKQKIIFAKFLIEDKSDLPSGPKAREQLLAEFPMLVK